MHQRTLALGVEAVRAAPFNAEKTFNSIIATIQSHYLDTQFAGVAVASSFGKDSTLVAIAALEAVKRLADEGRASKPLVIMTSNTRIENPLVERMVDGEIAKIEAYAAAHGLPVNVLVGKPTLASSWAVKLIAGQGLAPMPGGQGWCTEDWKIKPLKRALKRWAREHSVAGELLKLTGTRFSESTERGRKMTQRGESATRFTRNRQGEALLSPIAELTADQVWELLGLVKAGALPGAYSDFEAIFEVYAKAGGTSCAVVADERLAGQHRGECSARTGCFACTKVERDASLESMLDSHPELSRLYRIREWLAAITFDWEKRSWIGRTVQDDHIVIGPDSYAPAVCEDLLRYCLTADVEERERAVAKNERPMFEIIGLETLIAIDFLWSVHGSAPAFEAWRIYRDVYEDGSRYHPPAVPRSERSPAPQSRYLYVGKGWEQGLSDGYSYAWSGLNDPLLEALEADTGADIAKRVLPDGREILDLEPTESMEVNLESTDTWDFLQFQLGWEIEQAERLRLRPSSAARTYLRHGIVRYPNHGVLDGLLRRVAFREAHGLTRDADPQTLLDRSISQREWLERRGIEAGNDLFAAA